MQFYLVSELCCQNNNEIEWITEASVIEDCVPNRVLRTFPNTKKPILYLSNFGTKVESRHKGYGREMIEAIKKYFVGSIIYLYVFPSSDCSISFKELVDFYKSEGFVEVGGESGVYYMYMCMAVEL